MYLRKGLEMEALLEALGREIGPALGRLHPKLLETSKATNSVSTTGTISGHAEKRVSAMGYSQRIDDLWHCQRLSRRGETIRRFLRRCVHGRVGDWRGLELPVGTVRVDQDRPQTIVR